MTTSTSNDFYDSSDEFAPNLDRREVIGSVFKLLFLFGLLIGLFVLALLLFDVAKDGLTRFLTNGFITETPSRFPDQGGIRPAIVRSE